MKFIKEQTNKVNGCMSPLSFISPPKFYKLYKFFFFAPGTFLNYEGFMKSYE